MPIHDQGYRRYAGRRHAMGGAWWVIARQQLLTYFRQRRFVVFFVFTWLPVVARIVQIYIGVNFRQASFLATSVSLFRGFLDFQALFVFLLTVFAAGAIADDRRANALQVYLSKPLTRTDYIAGKLFAPLALTLSVTLLPAFLLLLVHVTLAGNLDFVQQNLFVIPAVVVYSIAYAFVATFTMMALSSLSKSRRFAALTFAGAFFFTSAMYQALQRITGSRVWVVISPRDTLSIIADAAFRAPGPRAVPLWAALLTVAVLIGASLFVLERRVRGVEVVR
jgi:ABC-2 type transport system permease protein